MTGKQLYELYRAALFMQHVATDEFENLGPDDQWAWNMVAGQVQPAPTEADAGGIVREVRR